MTKIVGLKLGSLFQRLFDPHTDYSSAAEDGRFFRLALAMAMASVTFETGLDLFPVSELAPTRDLLVFIVEVCSIPFALTARFNRVAIGIFSCAVIFESVMNWSGLANHSWLAAWCIPVAAVFREWWKSQSYSDYLRLTLGVVMLAAAAQKLLAGTYVDGTYIAYMSTYGSTTEQMFSFFCSREETLQSPCAVHRGLGVFIVIWQLAVGFLLVLGLRSILFLAVEVSFLLGAGLYADEMNFQVLNISLLCIAFRVGMSYWLAGICAFLLLIDTKGIGRLLEYVI
jgi:hypothetical protein